MAEVTVRRGSDGVWWCRPYLGTDPVTGRAIRPYRKFPEAGSEAEALEMARRWADGVRDRDLSAVLGAYVDHVAAMGAPRGSGPRANTVRGYRTQARRVARLLPGARVDELTPREVTSAYRRMLGEGLSPSTVAGTHWFLCGALRWAVRQGYCESSPMADVDHPTAPAGPSGAARALDEAEAAALAAELGRRLSAPGPWDAAKRDALGALIGLKTGMRAGEVAGLRRADLRPSVPDLRVCGTAVESGGLHRQAAPKRGRCRCVAIGDADLSAVLAALRAQGDLGRRAPIVTVSGELTRPSALNEGLRDACEAAGLPGWVHFHTLRHTHATLLLLGGTSARVVQERLGHADVATTLRLYGHVLPGRDAEAARAFAETIGRAAPGGDV